MVEWGGCEYGLTKKSDADYTQHQSYKRIRSSSCKKRKKIFAVRWFDRKTGL